MNNYQKSILDNVVYLNIERIKNNYKHTKIVIKGKPISELLQENVPSIFMKLQGSHFMRWGYNDEKFSRPIKWIVSILDKEEVKIKIITRKCK